MLNCADDPVEVRKIAKELIELTPHLHAMLIELAERIEEAA